MALTIYFCISSFFNRHQDPNQSISKLVLFAQLISQINAAYYCIIRINDLRKTDSMPQVQYNLVFVSSDIVSSKVCVIEVIKLFQYIDFKRNIPFYFITIFINKSILKDDCGLCIKNYFVLEQIHYMSYLIYNLPGRWFKRLVKMIKKIFFLVYSFFIFSSAKTLYIKYSLPRIFSQIFLQYAAGLRTDEKKINRYVFCPLINDIFSHTFSLFFSNFLQILWNFFN